MKQLKRIPEVTATTLNRYWAWVGGGGYGACIGNDKNVGLEEVGPHFVETMKMRILAGRDLEAPDAVGSRNVLVNESLARQYYSDGNALGQPIALQACGSFQETGTIVGVVADAKLSPSARLTPTTFAPFRAREKDSAILIVRFAGDAETLTPTLRRVLRDADRRVSAHSFTRQTDRLNNYLFEELILPGVLLFCGATALLLASIGIYGALSYSAQRRKAEIGVREALGALPSRIVRHIVWELLLPVMTGLGRRGLRTDKGARQRNKNESAAETRKASGHSGDERSRSSTTLDGRGSSRGSCETSMFGVLSRSPWRSWRRLPADCPSALK